MSWVELGRSLVGFRIKAMREILVFQRFEIDVECVSALGNRVQLIAINCTHAFQDFEIDVQCVSAL